MFYDLFSWLTTGLRRNCGSQRHLTFAYRICLGKGAWLVYCARAFLEFLFFCCLQYPKRSNTTVLLSVLKGGFHRIVRCGSSTLHLYLIPCFIVSMQCGVLHLCSDYILCIHDLRFFLHLCTIAQKLIMLHSYIYSNFNNMFINVTAKVLTT